MGSNLEFFFFMLKIRTLQDSDISLSASACSSVIRNEFTGVEGEGRLKFYLYSIM